jgi:hypothetical protein
MQLFLFFLLIGVDTVVAVVVVYVSFIISIIPGSDQ